MDPVAETEGERYTLDGARVCLHVTYVGDERIVHVDVDHPDLEEIFREREASYVGARSGGIYVGLRSGQMERAESLLRERVPD